MLIVKKAVKELVNPYRTSKEFFEALDRKVEQLIKDAMERGRANRRLTLRACDL